MEARTNREPESEREMVVSRIISAPRHLVFKAFTEARHLARWFGPDGFTLTTHEFSFQVGGVWGFTMHGPDGTDYPNWIRFQEIKPPERLVYEQGMHADDPQAFETTITFADKNGSTEVTLRGLFRTKARLQEVIRAYGALEGAKQHLGRLAVYMAEMAKAGS